MHWERDVFVSHSSWVSGWACIFASMTGQSSSYFQLSCIKVSTKNMCLQRTVMYENVRKQQLVCCFTSGKDAVASSSGAQFGSTLCPGDSGHWASLYVTRQHDRRHFHSFNCRNIIFNRWRDYGREQQICGLNYLKQHSTAGWFSQHFKSIPCRMTSMTLRSSPTSLTAVHSK